MCANNWFLSLKKKHRLRIFLNMMPSSIYGPNERMEKNYLVRSSIICAPRQILFRLSNKRARNCRNMWHIWGRKNPYRILVLKTMSKTPFGRLSVDGIIILNGHQRSRTRRPGLDNLGLGKVAGFLNAVMNKSVS
jgi:hypothetical protein